MKTSIKVSMLALVVGLTSVAAGCGEEEKKDEGDEELSDEAILPDARGINLSSLGGSASETQSLRADAATRDCSGAASLGIFGLALGPACELAPIASDVLYGSAAFDNPDAKAPACADYVPGKDDQGLLMALLCEKEVLKEKEIISLRFLEDGKTTAILFADFAASDGATAVGSWTARGADVGRYPANIRFWSGTTPDALPGILAMNLKSATSGSVYIDFKSLGSDLLASVDFAAAGSTSDCAKAPSTTTCHFEEIAIKGPEVSTAATPIPGLRVRIFGSDRKDASFLALEGKYRLTEDTAAKWFADPTLPASFRDVRSIYFRTVQKGTQIWGTFDFQDATGQTISAITSGDDSINITKVLRDGLANQAYAGVCQDLGTDRIADCKDIDVSAYDGLWVGSAKLIAPPADFALPVSFSDIPTKDGVVTK